MNERIRELAEQSLPNVKYWNEEVTKGDTPPKFRSISLDELEKFAELIVRECAEFVGDTFFDFNGDDIVKKKLLEHFGVE